MTVLTVGTPHGPSRLTVHGADAPRAVLLLGHGAGGGISAFDLVTLAAELPAHGIVVVLHEQPWRVAGRRIAGRPPTLDEGWRPALDRMLQAYPGVPLWVGGRSAGARVACRCFDHRQAGVICLAFPLHPPGRPENSRIAELAGVGGPALVLQGERDPFGSPEDVRTALAGYRAAGATRAEAGGRPVRVESVPGTHSFNRRADVRARIVEQVAGFLAVS